MDSAVGYTLGAGDQRAACGWSPWKVGFGASGFFQTLLGVLRVWLRGQRGLLGHHPGKSEWLGWGVVPRNLPSSVPCLLLSPVTQASAFLPLSPHSCNISCPSGFHGNNCSVPCECPEGHCNPVSGACQLGKMGSSNQGKNGPLHEFQKFIMCQGA